MSGNLKVHVVFIWRARPPLDIEDARFEREIEWPAVPRVGDLVDVGGTVRPPVTDVVWWQDGRVSVSLENVTWDEFGEASDRLPETLVKLGWTKFPIGRAPYGMWPTDDDIAAARKRLDEAMGTASEDDAGP